MLKFNLGSSPFDNDTSIVEARGSNYILFILMLYKI